MSLYEKIYNHHLDDAGMDVFGMSQAQMTDIRSNAPGIYSMIHIAFKFGFLQGQRYEWKKNHAK